MMEDFELAQILMNLGHSAKASNKALVASPSAATYCHAPTQHRFPKRHDSSPLQQMLPPTQSQSTAEDWFWVELRRILNNKNNNGIVSWLPEGIIWRIHDVSAFETQVLPALPTLRHFSLPLFLVYATIVKGFQQVSSGENTLAFYHKVCPVRNENGVVKFKFRTCVILTRMFPSSCLLPEFFSRFSAFHQPN